jgi:hypothetical protein
MSPCCIGRRRTLRVTILAVVKTVLGFGWHTERSAKAITLYIGATAKWAGIKFGVTHVSNSALPQPLRLPNWLTREGRIVSVSGEAPPVHTLALSVQTALAALFQKAQVEAERN